VPSNHIVHWFDFGGIAPRHLADVYGTQNETWYGAGCESATRCLFWLEARSDHVLEIQNGTAVSMHDSFFISIHMWRHGVLTQAIGGGGSDTKYFRLERPREDTPALYAAAMKRWLAAVNSSPQPPGDSGKTVG
jgi:hypothetical protein